MLLSVIIPAYNEQANLESCVVSVLSGVGADSEILVVDDGSTDNTASVARWLARQHPSVHLLQHPGSVNRGVSATRNLGLENATGEYIVFVDADDICQPTRFINSIEILQERRDIDGVLVPVRVIFEEGANEAAKAFLPEVLDHDPGIAPDDFAGATLEGRSRFHISNVIFRKSLLLKSGVFNIQRKLGEEDTDLWLRMALCGRFCVADTNVPQIFYRRHVGNSWQPDRTDYFRDLMVLGEVLKWAKKSPWVSKSNVKRIENAFSEKFFYCLTLARAERIVSLCIKLAWQAGIGSPRLILRSRYWRNLLHVTWN
jgi:glycosyltransferase involved in cell wall biosynthesis